MGGRRRKTKAEMEMTGAATKHPERMEDRAVAPKPEGPLGAPPACFDPDSYTGSRLLAIWHELAVQVPAGVLTSADRMHFEATCRLVHKIRFLSPKSGDFSQLKDMLGKMAMNPADRSKVNIAPGAGVPAGAGVIDGNRDSSGSGGNAFRAIAEKAAKLRPN